MSSLLCIVLAVLSIWDYPDRYATHDRLRRQFVAALREGDTETMSETCDKGVALLPDDPTWHYNRACALAYYKDRQDEAFDELEKAIDRGFRDDRAIAADTDLKRLSTYPRYEQLLEYARQMKSRPMLFGPMAFVDATGVFGHPIALGEQNLGWDFDTGSFVAHLKLAPASAGGNTGDLYMNRDAGHSVLNASSFPGLTVVKFDQAGRKRGADLNAPNIIFPYPMFGNCSRAFVDSKLWRSIPRALMTANAVQMRRFVKFYLSNQFWVFPANADTPPVGTNGDVFASIAPYWLVSAGRSYSDVPCLKAALEASRSFRSDVKNEIVRRGLLTPTIQTLMRKSLVGVTNEVDYLTPRAHPTAFAPESIDVRRLVASAAALDTDAIPPLAPVSVIPAQIQEKTAWPELTYASPFSWAFVLRAKQEERVFELKANGANEYAFVQTHGVGTSDVKIERTSPSSVRVTVRRSTLSPTRRVDIAVFGRNQGTSWGAPSYVSFSRMDPTAPYSDPMLTPLAQPSAK